MILQKTTRRTLQNPAAQSKLSSTVIARFLFPRYLRFARDESHLSFPCHPIASLYLRADMKWFSASAAVLFLASNLAVLAGPDEDYISIYQQIEEADRMAAANQTSAARQRYAQVAEALKRFKAANPGWNE